MPGVSIYRMKSLSETIDFLEGTISHSGFMSGTVEKALSNKDDLLKLSKFLLNLNSEYFQRIERDIIDFYTNDAALHSLIENTFTKIVRNSFVPRDTLIEELDSNKYIICKKLPHNRYKFKVYLLPHKLKHDYDEKSRYVEWLQRNNKVSISDRTVHWFKITDWYWDRRYMYVEDEQSLLLVRMRNPTVLGRIYEYLVCDK